ncbi:hypothetical protein CRG98_008906 [Punica granatum]|uniref:Uncharacterized protein n=1 Tax=Punica granatum TaxID=22663 RepID=A0A2I0KQT6_PUNGR|nr:hypothetical protein CRG98_008906 [Punica granatum]
MVPVGHAHAYRNILNDALAALSIIRRAVGLGPFSSRALGRNGPNFRAGPAKERTGSRPVSQGRSGSGGQRRPRFSPLDAAMRVGTDAGDGFGHRLGFAVVDRGLTGV